MADTVDLRLPDSTIVTVPEEAAVKALLELSPTAMLVSDGTIEGARVNERIHREVMIRREARVASLRLADLSPTDTQEA